MQNVCGSKTTYSFQEFKMADGLSIGGQKLTRLNASPNTSVCQDNLYNLGRLVDEQSSEQFEDILRKSDFVDPIDITGWTIIAFRILIQVLSEMERSVTIKCGEKHYKIARFPIGPMLDALAESILTGIL